MTREIKFRAWDWDGETMQYFSLEDTFLTDWELKVPTYNAVVMQYTGLKDKNGKEIYEGDVVRYDNLTALVEWGGSWGEAGFVALADDQDDRFNVLIWKENEVIGNIYENPELLEPKK